MVAKRQSDPRCVEIPAEHVELLASAVRDAGIAEACAQTGLSRHTLLGVIVTHRGMPGTAAIVREFAARKAAA